MCTVHLLINNTREGERCKSHKIHWWIIDASDVINIIYTHVYKWLKTIEIRTFLLWLSCAKKRPGFYILVNLSRLVDMNTSTSNNCGTNFESLISISENINFHFLIFFRTSALLFENSEQKAFQGKKIKKWNNYPYILILLQKFKKLK